MEDENMNIDEENKLNEDMIPTSNTNDNSNKNKAPRKYNRFVMAGVILFIMSLAFYLYYDNFIKEDLKPNDKSTNDIIPSTPIPPTPGIDNISLEGKIFKNNDSTKELRIVSKNDNEALEEAKRLNIDVNFEFDYFGYYNNTLFILYHDGEHNSNKENLKYQVVGGRKEGLVPQCRDTHEFIINKLDNTLVDLDYENNGGNVKVFEVNGKYYFVQGSCALAFMPNKVYNEEVNEIGQLYYGNDENGNIYVLNNNKVTKYSPNGDILNENTTQYDKTNLGYSKVIYKDTIYLLLQENDKIYLLDGLNNEKYELGNNQEISFSDFEEAPGIELDLNNDNIEIFKYNENNYEEKVVLYTFNPSTKELQKN